MTQLLQELKVDFMVAPFEADAQLAHLSRTDLVDAVMSDDGDLLVAYRCRQLLFDLEKDAETVNKIGWGQILKGLKETCFRDMDGENCYQKMGWIESAGTNRTRDWRHDWRYAEVFVACRFINCRLLFFKHLSVDFICTGGYCGVFKTELNI